MGQKIKKALVVDDSRLARVALCKQLQKLAIETEVAGNGGEAISYLQGSAPDVVFMDFMMPDMDGFEAARRVLSDPSCAHPPIVMYTSQDTEEDRARAKEVGISAFLVKPSSEERLAEVIATLEGGELGVPAVTAAPPVAEAAPQADAPKPQVVKASVADLPWDQLRAVAREAARLAATDLAREVAEHSASTAADRAVREQLQAFRSEIAETLRASTESARDAAVAAAEESARAAAVHAAEQSARKTAEELTGRASESLRQEVEARIGQLSQGGEFRALVKGVVFEHALPGIQQAVLPHARKAAEDVAAAQAQTLQPRLDALRGELEALQGRLEEAKADKGKLLTVAAIAGAVAGAVVGALVGTLI